MAYVLAAVGMLMAAAGLYVIGYGWLEARFEDYWPALAAGATLTAGGIVTVALGAAVRMLSQIKTALTARPAEALASTPAIGDASAASMPEAIEPSVLGLPATIEPPVAGPDVTRDPHPLRPGSSEPAASVPASLPPAIPAAVLPSDDGAAGSKRPHDEFEVPSPVVAAHEEAPGSRQVEPQDHGAPVATPDDPDADRPADDYKLEMPSTTEHDLPEAVPAKAETNAAEPSAANIARTPEAPAETVSPVAKAGSDDWLDRALADIDEELPLHPPVPRSPPIAPITPRQAPRPDAIEQTLEPAMAEAEPVEAVATHGETRVALPPATSPVIGRYEAEGTSYVMYADGSIEAQSSAGIYRFASMAELKAFIET